MTIPSSSSQLTSLFENTVLNQIERMRLKPMRRLTNRSRGEHLSGKGGSSTDFADYRDYAAGDDLRYVDWNIFARLHRPYIKQFQHEEELHVVLIIDASTSMLFENKLLRARQLAAAFGIMGLLNVERVSAYAVHQKQGEQWILPPGAGRQKIRPLLTFLEQIGGGGNVPVEKAIETVMQGDLRLVDSETGETLDITNASELVNIYHDQRLWLQETLDTLCRRRNGRFISTNSGTDLRSVLFDQLCRQGWVTR